MAVLKVIGSGSKGNGYVIECSNESLVIELGVSYKDFLKNTDLTIVSAALVSHKHNDHFQKSTATHFAKARIPVYSNTDVAEYSSKYMQVSIVEKGMKYTAGGFSFQPIPLNHSAENFGYVINHDEIGKLAFVTDTSDFKYRIKDVNHWLIEANYDPSIVIDNKLSPEGTRSNYSDHLSKQQCIDALKENLFEGTRSITLIHLSDDNSNAEDFKKDVSLALGFRNVNVAGIDNTVQTINIS